MQSKIHLACAVSFLHVYKYFVWKEKFNANKLWKRQPCLYFCMINLMQYTSFESIKVSVHVKVMYFSNVQIFVCSPKEFSHTIWSWHHYIWKLHFCKKKIFFKFSLLVSRSIHMCICYFQRRIYRPMTSVHTSRSTFPGRSVSRAVAATPPTDRRTGRC